jgi:hypothetical protein
MFVKSFPNCRALEIERVCIPATLLSVEEIEEGLGTPCTVED